MFKKLIEANVIDTDGLNYCLNELARLKNNKHHIFDIIINGVPKIDIDENIFIEYLKYFKRNVQNIKILDIRNDIIDEEFVINYTYQEFKYKTDKDGLEIKNEDNIEKISTCTDFAYITYNKYKELVLNKN